MRGEISHYRVPVYNYLSAYLKNNGFLLSVVAKGVQEGNPHPLCFRYRELSLNFRNLRTFLIHARPDALIFWAGPRPYIPPVLLLAKRLKIKIIHWGHRRPMHPYAPLKRMVYNLEHWADDAVILYAEHLREYVWARFQSKTFVANNTLHLTGHARVQAGKEYLKSKYGIPTAKNIICLGRMQRRKRIDYLVQAFRLAGVHDAGLILAGPDSEGMLKNIEGKNIFKLGPVYGKESLDLLSACDVYCMPGAIGLCIVDAFYCGLPVVTENVVHGPEIMYLKNGINGFMVPEGDITQFAARLKTLLTDDALRERFSRAARNEIATNGHIDRLCEGFRGALQYVFNQQLRSV